MFIESYFQAMTQLVFSTANMLSTIQMFFAASVYFMTGNLSWYPIVELETTRFALLVELEDTVSQYNRYTPLEILCHISAGVNFCHGPCPTNAR